MGLLLVAFLSILHAALTVSVWQVLRQDLPIVLVDSGSADVPKLLESFRRPRSLAHHLRYGLAVILLGGFLWVGQLLFLMWIIGTSLVDLGYGDTIVICIYLLVGPAVSSLVVTGTCLAQTYRGPLRVLLPMSVGVVGVYPAFLLFSLQIYKEPAVFVAVLGWVLFMLMVAYFIGVWLDRQQRAAYHLLLQREDQAINVWPFPDSDPTQ